MVAVPLAVAAYVLIQLVYLWEQDRASLLVAMPTPPLVLQQTLLVHGASLAGWLVLAAAASIGARRVVVALYGSQQLLVKAREAQALSDPLTGLHNRRSMEDRMQLLHALAERSGRPYSVISLDADGLKELNDSLGHQAGDEAIRDIADALRASTRAIDHCIRLGGDEFVVLLPDTDLSAAVATAERLLSAVRERRRPDRPRLLQVSAGVGVWRNGLTAREVLKAADSLLLEAKRAGKGRVVAASPEERPPIAVS